MTNPTPESRSSDAWHKSYASQPRALLPKPAGGYPPLPPYSHNPQFSNIYQQQHVAPNYMQAQSQFYQAGQGQPPGFAAPFRTYPSSPTQRPTDTWHKSYQSPYPVPNSQEQHFLPYNHLSSQNIAAEATFPRSQNAPQQYAVSRSPPLEHAIPRQRDVPVDSRGDFESWSQQRRSESRERSNSPGFDHDEFDDVLENFPDADPEYRKFALNVFGVSDVAQKIGAKRTSKSKLRKLGRGGRTQEHDEQAAIDKPRKQRKSAPRGPRKAAPITGDIKLRLSKANEAFLNGNYQEALDYINETIRINAEIYEAWAILATIFQEQGKVDEAIMALTCAAHLQPKNVAGWITVARMALEETGNSWRKHLRSAFYCYGAALRADSKNIEARLGRARIHLENEHLNGVLHEYKSVLKIEPFNLEAVRGLVMAHVDQDEVGEAKDLYKQTIEHFKSTTNEEGQLLDWDDICSYITLFQLQSEHAAGLKELKSFARWILGREEESYFDNITEDDREWDTDDHRRFEVPEFIKGKFPGSAYGDGLPVELRIKMGLCRLEMGYKEEAMHHFAFLYTEDHADQGNASEYSDLYLEIAKQLLAKGLYKDALNYFQPLKDVEDQDLGFLFTQMGKCYQGINMGSTAEGYYQSAIHADEAIIEARVELAKMYEAQGQPEQAFIFMKEVMSIKKRQAILDAPAPRRYKKREKPSKAASAEPERRPSSPKAPTASKSGPFTITKAMTKYRPRHLLDPLEREREEAARSEQLGQRYDHVLNTREAMRNGEFSPTQAWIHAARDLTDDFRGCKAFYPFDKYVKFLGYEKDPLRSDFSLDPDLGDMMERLSKNLEVGKVEEQVPPQMPLMYRGISFHDWLDLFLEFALCLARNGKRQESYELCEAAKDAIVFYRSREDLFLIHVSWCCCAILAGDEETCVTVARHFMKDYQFTTDSYRMFAGLVRMCHSPISWYSAGPTQKFMLRQIKAMDYSLVDPDKRAKYFTERASYSAKDAKGQPIINNDMDISLLMLYGHILYTSSSYAEALNYFFRAYALDKDNPMINLSIGLAYAHEALKRQSDNRQHLILQGLTFLFTYYDSRKLSMHSAERQEAHYNVARTYHMLGLTNLAIPYYLLVLEECNESAQDVLQEEDFVVDTAYNLQMIYATAGNLELAAAVSEKWLVI